jgi:hypothetical protein
MIVVGSIILIICAIILLFTYVKDRLTPQQRMDELLETKHSTRMGWFAAWRQEKNAAARADALFQINRETEELGKLEERRAEATVMAAQHQVEIRQRQTLIKQLEFTESQVDLDHQLIAIAKERGLPRSVIDEVSKAKLLSDVKVQENWQLIEQDLKAAELYETSEDQLIESMTDRLVLQVYARHKLYLSDVDPAVKDRLLARYDKNIASLEAKIDAKQGLLLPQNGEEETRPPTLPPDSAGRNLPPPETSQEQVPGKRNRGRPRKTLSN